MLELDPAIHLYVVEVNNETKPGEAMKIKTEIYQSDEGKNEYHEEYAAHHYEILS